MARGTQFTLGGEHAKARAAVTKWVAERGGGAVRFVARLFDVPGLKKVRITGPDALAVLNHMCTRELTQIYPSKSVCAVVCDGGFTDDCVMR